MRVFNCPKDLLNGPCGGALEGKCEVNSNSCPWYYLMERFELLDGAPLLVEHPVVLEMERIFEGGEVNIKKSSFIKNLERGKAISVEFPIKLFEKGVREFRKVGDIYTIPDNPLGYPHISSTALGVWLKSKGYSVMPHLTAKDRNVIAITSEFRTVLEFDFEGVLITTGDWSGFMIQGKPVFDLDSSNMIRLAKLMFSGILPTGERFEVKERPFIAGTINPNYPAKLEGKRLARKILAGVDLVISQVVANRKVVREIPRILQEALKYSPHEVPVVISLLYPLKRELESVLRKMGIKTGDDIRRIVEEVSSLELGGINIIVFEETKWDEKLNEILDLLKEVF
ncbi:MAG: hypothetical protein PWP39_363 [Pyrococcus sp.]|uniref:methylenetetrahydrofolate reductase C-terminal domain-containing protein n=1 Tax=Pyrococcus sp. TaxID=33866 RepID=UPI002588817E|nr:methylenetetrahydrofolate reductase C-terminal domain-containing protein [Pyrococcus sp.]MDK2869128.1 hypothetical protein [Pyrococcus sp.]